MVPRFQRRELPDIFILRPTPSGIKRKARHGRAFAGQNVRIAALDSAEMILTNDSGVLPVTYRHSWQHFLHRLIPHSRVHL